MPALLKWQNPPATSEVRLGVAIISVRIYG